MELLKPAPLAARHVSLSLLQQADLAFGRLGQTDPEALHDFRVAVRRLRSCLRAYRPYLPKPLGGKLRKRLGALMEATNLSRDDEVHLLWLDETLARARLAQAARLGLEAIRAQIAQAQQANGIPQEVAEFADLSAEAHRQLLQGAFAVSSAPSFAAVNAALLESEGELLRQELSEIAGADDEATAHRARLSAKRLRYLLEPLRGELNGAKAAIKQLRSLQDALGELHDLHTLEARLAAAIEQEAQSWARNLVASLYQESLSLRSGQGNLRRSSPGACYALAAALQVVRKAQARRYQTFMRTWNETAAAGFFARLQQLAQQLSALEPAPTPTQ